MRSLILISVATLLIFSVPVSGPVTAADDSLITAVEDAIVKQTNEFRLSKGLDSVTPADGLQEAAVQFAKFMAETEKYGHRADGRTPAQRAKAAGYDYCVVRENIAYRTNSGEVTADSLIEVFVQGWIDSPPHRENMLADYITETGAGVATSDGITYYAVQMFGRPKAKAIKLTLENLSGETKTIIMEANDSIDEIEMPMSSRLRMQRCFPTTLNIKGGDDHIKLNESANLVIKNESIEKK